MRFYNAAAGLIATVCGMLGTSAPVAIAQPVANMGTLTCAASPAEKELLGSDRQLSCTFEPLTGAKASLVGKIKRDETRNESGAKIILVWSVLGPKVGTSVKQLEGSYHGVAGSEANGLVGGATGDIALKPVTPDNLDLGETAAFAVLELQLAAIKT
jgi:hypothetical protein